MSTVKSDVRQIVISAQDDYARCGPAQFAIVGATLEVRYEREGRRPLSAEYGLNDAGFNRAYRLRMPNETLSWYLICREWENVHVRYGPLAEGKEYPVLSAQVGPREVRLVDDGMASAARSSASHPNRDIGMCARLVGDWVFLECYDGGLATFHQELKLSDLPSHWYAPVDKGGRPLPVCLKRPLLARLSGVRCVDVQWIG